MSTVQLGGKSSSNENSSAVSFETSTSENVADVKDTAAHQPWYKRRRFQLGAAAGAVALAVAIAVPCALLLGKRDGSSAGTVEAASTQTIIDPSGSATTPATKRLCDATEEMAAVVINEVYPNKPQDWVELHNTNTGCDVLLDGWSMRDSNTTNIPLQFRGACGRLPAGGFLVVGQGNGPCEFDFGLSDKQDSVVLYKGTTMRANVTWTEKVPDNATYARTNSNSYAISTTITKGAANTVETPPPPAPVDYDRNYPTNDEPSAYTGKQHWDTVDELEIQTWDTPTALWNDMYNQKRVEGNATKDIAIGACIRTYDYPSDLSKPCGKMTIRGATARLAEVKSFSVKLDKNAPLGKWRGVRKLILSRSPYDYSRVKHALGYRLLRNVPNMVSLNANFVNVKINGTVWGLFTVIEDTDEDMLKRHGLNKDGFLLKAKDYGFKPPNALWPSHSDWLDPQTRDEDDAWFNKIANVSSAIAKAGSRNDFVGFEKIISEDFQIENLVTFLAVATLFSNEDILSQNYFLYSPSDARKWSMFFWDWDGGFDWCGQELLTGYLAASDRKPWCDGIMSDGNIVPLRVQDNRLYQQLMKVEGMLGRIEQRMRELTAPGGPLEPKKCQEMLQHLAKIVHPYIGLIPPKWADFKLSEKEFSTEVNRLHAFLGNITTRAEQRDVQGYKNYISRHPNLQDSYPMWKCPAGVSATWCKT